MAKAKERVKDRDQCSVYLTAETKRRLDRIAKRAEMSRATLMQLMIETSLDEAELLVKALTSKPGQAFVRLAKVLEGSKRRKSKGFRIVLE